MMGVRALFLAASLVFLTGPALAQDGGRVFLFHVKSSFRSCDHVSTVPQMALGALQKGYRVILLFDSRGVKLIKIGAWYGGDTTALDKADITESERKALAARLNLSLASTPSNYGEFLRLLRGKGVELYANEKMMDFYGIEKDEYDTAVTPVGIEKIVELFEQADIYVSY